MRTSSSAIFPSWPSINALLKDLSKMINVWHYLNSLRVNTEWFSVGLHESLTSSGQRARLGVKVNQVSITAPILVSFIVFSKSLLRCALFFPFMLNLFYISQKFYKRRAVLTVLILSTTVARTVNHNCTMYILNQLPRSRQQILKLKSTVSKTSVSVANCWFIIVVGQHLAALFC